jgi:aminoglycoside phosphotransferase (APT) family kinase protein
VSAINRVSELHDARGRLVRREWAPLQIACELGINPDIEVEAQRFASLHGLAPPVFEYDRVRRFMVMPFIDGIPLESDWIERPARRKAMRELITRLRSIDSSRLPTLDIGGRLGELYDRLKRTAADRAALYRAQVDDCIAHMRALSTSGTSLASGTSLVHGDLTPENVLVRTDGSLCLIDWEYAHCGHPDEDLAGLAISTPGMEEWSLAPREFPIRINARQLLDTLWRELAAAVAE